MSSKRLIGALGRAPSTAALTFAAIGAFCGAHLLLLLAAALRSRSRCRPEPCQSATLAVVIPAHDEESQIAGTIASVRANDYPAAKRRIVVVADNCTDRTADAARSAGAEVWERSDPRLGKGYALAWALGRLVNDESIEGVCVVDADCEVSANLLSASASRLAAGAEAVQASYLVSNPDASHRAALRWAGFALFNVVRPRGRSHLGLSSGLLGTGMTISRGLLMRSPWQAFSYAEDREQHMRWVLDGSRVEFAPEAAVRSPTPSTRAGSRSQEARWESGRTALAVRMTPRLLGRWIGTGDIAALDAAIEPLLPPQSLLFGVNVVAVGASLLAHDRVARRIATGSLLAQFAYVLGGLVALEAPASVWRALPSVPWFLARRTTVLGGSLLGLGPGQWERTPRDFDPAPERGTHTSAGA